MIGIPIMEVDDMISFITFPSVPSITGTVQVSVEQLIYPPNTEYICRPKSAHWIEFLKNRLRMCPIPHSTVVPAMLAPGEEPPPTSPYDQTAKARRPTDPTQSGEGSHRHYIRLHSSTTHTSTSLS